MAARRVAVLGGIARAKQAAEYRKQNPTKQEKVVRDVVTDIFGADVIEFEHSLQKPSGVGFFYVDIWVKSTPPLAIEVDGGGWHQSIKMMASDDMKALAIEDMGIKLVRVNRYQLDCQNPAAAVRSAIMQAIGQEVKKDIPF